MIRTAAAFLCLVLAAAPALAGLQTWEVAWFDQSGNPSSYGQGKAEAFAHDSRGFVVSIGCAPGGGHLIAMTAPPSMQPDFAGQSIQPGLRLSRPGTDIFKGTVAMTFDGRRYAGPLPQPVVAPLREKIRDGVMMLTELGSHTTVKLELQSMERAMAEVACD